MYKRQGQPRPERQQHEHPPEPPLRLLIPQDGKAAEDLPADKFVAGKHARGLQPVRCERGEDPVSYTHLDVYKRQVGNCEL